jgi:hypothetical protein
MRLVELRVAEFCAFFARHYENMSELESFTLLDSILADAPRPTDALEVAEMVASHGVTTGKRCLIAVVLRWLLIRASERPGRPEHARGRVKS